MEIFHRLSGEKGAALLVALLALFVFTLLGVYMTLSATTGLHISDNYESRLQATWAALAGLNHASVLLRGLAFDELLKGPDGTYDRSPSYVARAKGFKYRLPMPLSTARSLDIFDPFNDVSEFPDDGLINTGSYGGGNGEVLIPQKGIGQVVPNPYGPGTIITSRYFVKVADNNGDVSEVSGDPDDNPFCDGDGVVIVRSLGVAKTTSVTTGSIPRFNSVAVFEGRFKRLSTWDLGTALVVIGDGVHANFDGTYEISGGSSFGIGTIDTVPGDAVFPDQIIRMAAKGGGNITGGGQSNPSVHDMTGQIGSNQDQLLLLNPAYLWDFIHDQALRIADVFFDGSQIWLDGNAPYIGSYDNSKPLNAPGQDPKITVVDGDLEVTGEFTGGGLLVVTGDLSFSGPYAYNGLILVIGSGSVTADGSGQGVSGGLFIANLKDGGEEIVFGMPSLSIKGDSRFTSNRDAVKMAIGLIPASQTSFREITNSDP
jgi:hypothetical protein